MIWGFSVLPSVQFSLCLCETTVIVGWMAALSVLLVSIHSDIHARVRLQCVGQCLQRVC